MVDGRLDPVLVADLCLYWGVSACPSDGQIQPGSNLSEVRRIFPDRPEPAPEPRCTCERYPPQTLLIPPSASSLFPAHRQQLPV